MEKEEFKERMKVTSDVEKEIESSEDSEKLEEILSGSKIVKVIGFPTLQFIYPDTGVVFEGDAIVAKFKSMQLRKGEFLTNAQLKAIYGRPVEIEIDGNKLTIGQGVWTQTEETDLELLPEEIKEKSQSFDNSRERYQEIETELLELTNSKKDNTKKTKLEIEKDKIFKEAEALYTSLNELKRKLLLLQIKKLELFSGSLEERAELEKIKYYAPRCIKKINKDGKFEPMWKDEEEMENTPFAGTKVLGLFNLFIRGYDISFFEDVAGK